MKFHQWAIEQRGRSVMVANALGVSQPTVSDWVAEKKAIPAAHCKTILRLSDGVVTCQEMRPRDWHKYWPELAEEAEGQGA